MTSTPTAATPLAVNLRGVHETRDLGLTKRLYPAMTTAGPFFLANVAPAAFLARVQTLCGPAWAAGLIPLWTWKPNPPDVAAGLWDMPLKTVRDYHLSKGLTSVAYPFHEPEDNMPGATFTTMFNRIYPLLSCPPNIAVGYTANSYQWRAGMPSTANPTDWAVAQTDFYGCDVYSGLSPSLPTDTLASHAGFQRWWIQLVHSGPFMLPERGFTGAVRTDTIESECDWLMRPEVPLTGYQIWNTVGTATASGWLLDPLSRLSVNGLLTCLSIKSLVTVSAEEVPAT
jgi:hypothetical protein